VDSKPRSYVQTTRKTFVQTIEPAEDALSMEEAVKLFCTVFKHVGALKVVDKLAVNSLTHELTSAEVTTVFPLCCSFSVDFPTGILLIY
jgi:hypothetical protein